MRTVIPAAHSKGLNCIRRRYLAAVFYCDEAMRRQQHIPARHSCRHSHQHFEYGRRTSQSGRMSSSCSFNSYRFHQSLVTVTVTEALVLRLILEDRGRITESIRILVPVNRIEQKCFEITTE